MAIVLLKQVRVKESADNHGTTLNPDAKTGAHLWFDTELNKIFWRRGHGANVVWVPESNCKGVEFDDVYPLEHPKFAIDPRVQSKPAAVMAGDHPPPAFVRVEPVDDNPAPAASAAPPVGPGLTREQVLELAKGRRGGRPVKSREMMPADPK
jgi:hypothetical protein